MKNDIGLTITEGVANNGVASYRDPSKRNIGLLGGAQRGVAWKAQTLTSMTQFESIFGIQTPNYYGPRMVKAIFDEAGEEVPVTINYVRAVTSTNAAAEKAITLEGAKTMTVKAGYKGSEDTGAWGNKLSVKLYSYDFKSRNSFVLEVIYDGKIVSTIYGATLAEIQNQVNTVNKYITVEFSAEIATDTQTSLTGTVTTTLTSDKVEGVGTSFLTDVSVGTKLVDSTGALIGTVSTVVSDTEVYLTGKALIAISAVSIKKKDDTVYSGTLTGGVDGTLTEADLYPVTGATNKGLAAFLGTDTQIIAYTEFHTLTMAKKLKSFVESWRTAIGVYNLPLNADAGLVEYWATQLQTSETSFLSEYLGWAKVKDENGNDMLIPGMAPVLGAGYLRTPHVQGDYIHIPPAGTDSAFKTVVEMIPHNLDQEAVNSYVGEYSCNVIRWEDQIGYYVGSSRTMSTNPLHQSVHTRLQTSYYKRVLALKMKYIEQKPKTPELRVKALTDLFTYFKAEYDKGALEREVPFSKAYKGVSDLSNNPTTQDRKDLNIDVYYIPTECTEAVKISLLRNDGILTINE